MLKIAQDLLEFNPEIWKRRTDAAGRSGQGTEVKVMVCLRVLGSGCSLEDIDDKARMAPETVRYYLQHFVKHIQDMYGSEYLNRYPGRAELQRIAAKYADDGFVGCIGAVDCCHLTWKNCPLEEKGQYHNPKDSKLAVMKVEAWCDAHLFIWHWHAGHAGTSNDKTMVSFSPLFQAILNGHYDISLDEYKVTQDSMSRTLAYLLGDGIYPRWPIFLLPIHQAQSKGEKTYTKRQEGRRKDIERAFGVLQARFRILRLENHRWDREEIIGISNTCVILHNLLIRMSQRGCFAEDIAEELEDIDIIGEMHAAEGARSATREEELQALQQERAEVEASLDPEELVDDLILRETELTSGELHDRLQRDFIARFASSSTNTGAADQ